MLYLRDLRCVVRGIVLPVLKSVGKPVEVMGLVRILGLDIFGRMGWLVRLMKVRPPYCGMLMEGDNYVISQQTARACLKYLANPTELPLSAKYLARGGKTGVKIVTMTDWLDSTTQLRMLEERSRQMSIKLGTLVQHGKAWKDLNMECVAVSRAHVEVFVLRTFLKTISDLTDSSLRSPLTKLCNLVCLSFVLLIIVCITHSDKGRR